MERRGSTPKAGTMSRTWPAPAGLSLPVANSHQPAAPTHLRVPLEEHGRHKRPQTDAGRLGKHVSPPRSDSFGSVAASVK